MAKRGLVAGAAMVAVLGGVVGFVSLRHRGTRTGVEPDDRATTPGGSPAAGKGAHVDDATIEGKVIDPSGRAATDAVVQASVSWKKSGSPFARMPFDLWGGFTVPPPTTHGSRYPFLPRTVRRIMHIM